MRVLSLALAVASLSAPAAAIEIDPDWSIARVWNETNIQGIRRSTPRPPVHARNLYHVSAAMYDAWTAYDQVGHGLFFLEKHTAPDVDAARHETVSYAAYRILKNRYVAGNGPNIAEIQALFDTVFAEVGYDASITTTVGNTPAAIGNRIASHIIALGLLDGSNQQANYAPNNGYVVSNPPMPFKIPGTTMNNPDNWQQLAFDFLVLQNGEIVGAALQTVVTPHWNGVTPYGMNDLNRNPVNNLYFDQGQPPLIGSQGMRDQAISNIEHSAVLDAALGTMVDVSPTAWSNSPLGSYEQPGYGLNPVTGQPYAPNIVNFADYARVNAEYWADGADSETPPGHWYVMANLVSDNPKFEHKLFGEGDPVDRLEWDVKMYLTLGGATHDASITAWGMKGEYDSSRPISFIRYMGQLGQSSDPELPSYHPNGLPLTPGLVRLVTADDVAPGGELEDLVEVTYADFTYEPNGIDNHIGDVVVMSWLGGFSAGTTTGIAVTGPIPGHIYRNDGGWDDGSWELGEDDTPGVLNPGLTSPASVVISESRNAQVGADRDEYVELSGPPGASLAGITFVVIGDEVQTGIPEPQGRIQVAIDLSDYSIGLNGTFLIGRSTLSLADPDLENLLDLKEIGNTTYALLDNFTGYLGQELDYSEDGDIDVVAWDSVIDAVAMRRNAGPAGVYFNAPSVGPVNSQTQTYGVGWQLATHWMTYQASNFVTPPFPGYTSGHSTYSRSAAEALTALTGSPYFPGGFQEYTIPAGWLKFENGPSVDLVFNWVRYQDLADQAGESRIWGGIHPPIDDLPGRISGSKIGPRAAHRTKALLEGLYLSPDIDGDGMVGFSDLTALLLNWGGPCPLPPVSCPGDLDGNGTVGFFDLVEVLQQWGPVL